MSDTVDVELVVGDERVGTLAGLHLERLELLEFALARLVDQPLLHVGRELDREDAEVSFVIELDHRVTGGVGNLLVGREQRVLERVDEGAALDALFALDFADGLDDLLRHLYLPAFRSRDEVAPDDRVVTGFR